jgi:D-glycero-alpha-D-manno-heptose-7-phosphate kinase
MLIASCPLRISLFGGSTDNPYFVEQYGYGAVISFTCDLKTYVTISQDKIGFNKEQHKYIINYSKREEVSKVEDIQNEVVRTVLEYFNMPPVQVTLTSDAYSQGSGLASSSSYTISLIKACCLFLKITMMESEICKLAYELERIYNPYCGYQDPYGCGVGGFKRIEFMNNDCIKYEFLSTELFDKYDTHLVFTGVTRNSKKILKNVTDNLEKVKPILTTVSFAYQSLIQKDYELFFEYLNQGWQQKKDTSSSICENEIIKEIDSTLKNNSSVLSHKLCGAGNGGFFLVFSDKDNLNIPYESVKINLSPEGVCGESI